MLAKRRHSSDLTLNDLKPRYRGTDIQISDLRHFGVSRQPAENLTMLRSSTNPANFVSIGRKTASQFYKIFLIISKKKKKTLPFGHLLDDYVLINIAYVARIAVIYYRS